ncbi:squalene/phytoene synthase family protein [Caldithrix abyssi]
MDKKIEYCENVLPLVSRTFAPTIRRLPKGLRLPVTVAYLLCRVADTIEDSPDLTIDQKKHMLTLYANIFSRNDSTAYQQLLALLQHLPHKTEDEKLTHNLPILMDVFRSFSVAMQGHIARWVAEMSLGMRKYAQAKQKRRFSFLKSMKELDEYTYYVAGTVGYLLTELFYFYSTKITPMVKHRLEQLAESFGKGLQLVNIIRDTAADLRRGQSYIPDELLHKYQLTRESIFKKENADRAQQLFNELIQDAVNHLDKALDYTLTIPKGETRIRLFCILPLFWALRTLELIQRNTLSLLGSEKIKISKYVIRKEFFLALIHVNSNRMLRWYYNRIRSAIARPALNMR